MALPQASPLDRAKTRPVRMPRVYLEENHAIFDARTATGFLSLDISFHLHLQDLMFFLLTLCWSMSKNNRY